jgi:hypothetical protein
MPDGTLKLDIREQTRAVIQKYSFKWIVGVDTAMQH